VNLPDFIALLMTGEELKDIVQYIIGESTMINGWFLG